jgi:biopolymer transport protein ExbB/TolQ
MVIDGLMGVGTVVLFGAFFVSVYMLDKRVAEAIARLRSADELQQQVDALAKRVGELDEHFTRLLFDVSMIEQGLICRDAQDKRTQQLLDVIKQYNFGLVKLDGIDVKTGESSWRIIGSDPSHNSGVL